MYVYLTCHSQLEYGHWRNWAAHAQFWYWNRFWKKNLFSVNQNFNHNFSGVSPLDQLSWKSVIIITIVNIILPSFDIYSDVALIILLLSLEQTEFPSSINFAVFIGYLMTLPLSLSTFFMLPHWYKCEKTITRRLLTLPVVLLQFYPQYRAFRILWLSYKKQGEKWKKEKLWNECNLANVGKFFFNYKKVDQGTLESK